MQANPAHELEILDDSVGRVFARYGPLFIGCWRERSTIEHLRRLRDLHHEQRRRYPEGYVTLTILEHGIPVERDREMVDFARSMRVEFAATFLRQAYVIPHAGFGGTMLRLMVNSVMRLVPSTPGRVFQILPEALAYLDEGPLPIPDRLGLERRMAVELRLRESTMRTSVRRIDS